MVVVLRHELLGFDALVIFFLCKRQSLILESNQSLWSYLLSALPLPTGWRGGSCSFILTLMFIICIWTERSSVLQDGTTLRLFKNRNRSPSHTANLNCVLNRGIQTESWGTRNYSASLPHFAFIPERWDNLRGFSQLINGTVRTGKICPDYWSKMLWTS